MRPAGLTNAEGKPKYTGLHTLRHFYASWRINADRGGQGLPAKEVSSGSAQLVSSGQRRARKTRRGRACFARGRDINEVGVECMAAPRLRRPQRQSQRKFQTRALHPRGQSAPKKCASKKCRRLKQLLNKCARNDQARALGQKQTFQRNRHVRFTPESGHVQCTRPCPLCANSGHGPSWIQPDSRPQRRVAAHDPPAAFIHPCHRLPR